MARVMYVSATGATDANNLCYMRRLGLWGAHTAFKDKGEFVHMLTKRGVSAMELVRASPHRMLSHVTCSAGHASLVAWAIAFLVCHLQDRRHCWLRNLT